MIFALKRIYNPTGRQEKHVKQYEQEKCRWTGPYTISSFNPHFRDEKHKVQGS